MDTVTLKIDGREIVVPKGRSVLQAAIEHGLEIPYYCFHPALTVDGSCRVCIVKIEKMPKLQTACSTVCSDGMEVHTAAAEVVEARASVLEFLLLNHPLDCPVCDKGGECPLQDFAYSFGPNESRMEFPRRVFDGEGARADVDFGPTLMLNRNRCILCTRCVRFMREIDGDPQIGIVDRGYGSEIATFQEQGVHSLLSGNLMDVCPVGAITTRDYRFKSRPWDNPQVVDTICTLCSKGCNTSLWLRAKPEWARGATLVRVTPRYNPDVNGYWMCDIGRFGYHWIENDRRLRHPMAVAARGEREQLAWTDALDAAGRALRAAADTDRTSVRFLVSAHTSVEEQFLVLRLAEQLTAGPAIDAVTMTWRRQEKPQPAAAAFVVPAEDAPNVRGARELGLLDPAADGAQADLSTIRAAVEAGRVAALYVVDPGPDGSLGDVAWVAEARQGGRLKALIVQGIGETDLTRAADVVLPGVTPAEKEASYVNGDGRLQAGARGLTPPGEAMEDWVILARLAAAAGIDLGVATATDVRAAIVAARPGSPVLAGIDKLAFGRPMPAAHWLQASNPSERWKWDSMFQDLPPVKGNVVTSSLPRVIPVRAVEHVE